jgi:fibrillarin-like rRNA methylase
MSKAAAPVEARLNRSPVVCRSKILWMGFSRRVTASVSDMLLAGQEAY